jgi:ATP-dependent helicase/nuclease subunit A
MSADRKVKWTEQQERAILARGGNVLVAASAGTGKTAVLSGRCVSLVSEQGPRANVLSMLVLTFTEAAAEQMRARIAQQLRDAFRDNGAPRLGRQILLLQGADVSTIHAFCRRLISEHFHELSLDPSFRVIDADEAMLLKAETLEQTVEWAWQQSHLVQGLGALFGRRDLRDSGGFLSDVVRLNDFLEGVVLPEHWCDLAQRLAGLPDPLSNDLGQAQIRMVEGRLDTILARLRQANALYEAEVPDGRWGQALGEQLIGPVTTCLDLLRAGDWDGCSAMIRDFERPKTPQLRGFPETVGEIVKDLRKKAIDELTGLRELAVVNPEYLDRVGRSAGLQTKVLIELAQRFHRLYGRRKQALNGLDFADLERHALTLLTAEGQSDEPLEPSEVALALRDRYRHIFVDEYQDVNAVQQAIIDALSSGDNVFGVGDVKQSIYGWRGAEPTIFLERLAPTSADRKDLSHNTRVDLNYNFRSAKGILDFVNAVFGRIMTSSLAGIDYDEAARLRPGPQGDSTAPSEAQPDQPIVELHILDETAKDQDAGSEDTSEGGDEGGEDVVRSRQRQAMLIAQRIRQIVGAETGRPEFQIFDKDASAFRDVAYRDIVVLMRSLAKKANDYVEVFRLAGIPVNCDATAGYFEATEISDVLCLLKVLDNPQRDIEFAAVLRSPYFRLSDTDLARIRLHGRTELPHGNYYACAARYRDDGSHAALRNKLAVVLETLERWRGQARRGHLADLLWNVYRETQFPAFVSALPNGQARKANLLKLHDRAIQFEGFASSAARASLTRFIEFIEKLQDLGQDWAPAQPGSAAGNAVRILSVHKSKGLEFPVVFLAELESQFNRRDIYADVVMDASDTVGLQIIDRQSNTKLRSLAHQVIGEKKFAAGLAEEMRILYVATTRARDRLILTASQKRTDCGKVLANGLLLGDSAIPAWLLKPCKNALEWALYGLSDQRVLHEAFHTGLASQTQDQNLFDFHLHKADDLSDLSRSVLTLRSSKAKLSFFSGQRSSVRGDGRRTLAQVRNMIEWQYPYAHAVSLAAKSSVTKLTHPDDIYVQRDYSEALDREPVALFDSGLDALAPRRARVAGTATHLVISSLDLRQPVTLEAVERTRGRLVEAGAIPPDVAEGVDAQAILAFFESTFGSVVCDERNAVWQEWSFTYGFPASELNGPASQQGDAAEEIIVVQGWIDLLVQTPEGLLVVDFKTDRVSGEDVGKRAEIYRAQLELYAKAAAAIRAMRVLERWLYFLVSRRAVQV